MKIILRLMLLASLFFPLAAKADYSFTAGAEFNLGWGNGNFTPFYLHANKHGKLTQSRNALLDIWAADSLDLSKRFDYAWGIEALAGWSNSVDYKKWNKDKHLFENNSQRPAAVWMQQLFAEFKWRSLYLSVGLKDRNSSFVDQELSSGDLLWSGNSRGIPEIRVGFVDFQNIPLLKKWVQIDLALSYGKFIDNQWVYNHFDYYTGKINPGTLWTYKRLYLRSNPEKPLSGQFGFQMSGLFGGKTYRYRRGELFETTNNFGGFKDFFLMLLPLDSQTFEGYKVGDHKGSWDIALRYRFKSGITLRAYTQWFWEDGSSLLKQNKSDGLWGVEFKMNKRWWISGAVLEFLDLTNMSGPLGYAPHYNNTGGATLPYATLGRDGYYNNYYYRAYVNYGLNMGTPMVQGLLFNTGLNKDNPYLVNTGAIPYFRVRAFHIAISGSIGENLDYIVKFNHRKGWGDTNSSALVHPAKSTSFMAGARYRLSEVPGLDLGVALAVDKGGLPESCFGILLSASYQIPLSVNINIKRKR